MNCQVTLLDILKTALRRNLAGCMGRLLVSRKSLLQEAIYPVRITITYILTGVNRLLGSIGESSKIFRLQFDYCSSVWGCIGVCQSERLQKLQNWAALSMTFSDLIPNQTVTQVDASSRKLNLRTDRQTDSQVYWAGSERNVTRCNSVLEVNNKI